MVVATAILHNYHLDCLLYLLWCCETYGNEASNNDRHHSVMMIGQESPLQPPSRNCLHRETKKRKKNMHRCCRHCYGHWKSTQWLWLFGIFVELCEPATQMCLRGWSFVPNTILIERYVIMRNWVTCEIEKTSDMTENLVVGTQCLCLLPAYWFFKKRA